jgi:hypothetical protein
MFLFNKRRFSKKDFGKEKNMGIWGRYHKKEFSIVLFIVFLILPGVALADLTGTWTFNSTSSVMGCTYSGTAEVVQSGTSLTGTANTFFQGSGCPAPVAIPLNCTLTSLNPPTSFTCVSPPDYGPIHISSIGGNVPSQDSANGSFIGYYSSPTNPISGEWIASNNQAVPTLTQWGMIIFMALAGIGAVHYLRRQRRAEN